MKKIFLSLFVVFSLTSFMSGQTHSKHALGLRFSPSFGGFGDYGIYKELSYQLATSKTNRIELDLGYAGRKDDYSPISTDIYKFVGAYQLLRSVNSGFGWYIGGGAGFGKYVMKFENGYSKSRNSETTFIFAVQTGVQYGFIGFPFLISVDLRPVYNTNNKWRKNDPSTWLAFSGRFTF